MKKLKLISILFLITILLGIFISIYLEITEDLDNEVKEDDSQGLIIEEGSLGENLSGGPNSDLDYSQIYKDEDFNFAIQRFEGWSLSENIINEDYIHFTKELNIINGDSFIRIKLVKNPMGGAGGLISEGDLKTYKEIQSNCFSMWVPFNAKGKFTHIYSDDFKDVILNISYFEESLEDRYVGEFSLRKDIGNERISIRISNSEGDILDEIIAILETITFCE